MKRNITLKVGALSLLVAAGFTVYAGMPADSPVPAQGVAPWDKDAEGAYRKVFYDAQAEDLLQAYNAGGILNLFKDEQKKEQDDLTRRFYQIPFDDMDKSLMPGVYVGFDGLGDGDFIHPGNYDEISYSDNYSNVSYSMIAKVTDNNAQLLKTKVGLGIMPVKEVTARAEFLISTRGLSDVTSLHFKMGATGGEGCNRQITWEAIAYVHSVNDDGTLSNDRTQIDFTDRNGNKNFLISPKQLSSTGFTGYELRINEPAEKNGFDNKIIRVVVQTKAPSLPIEGLGSETNQVPVTVIGDFQLDYRRPSITFSNTDKTFDWSKFAYDPAGYESAQAVSEPFEAGAGRHTDSKALFIKVNQWNPAFDLNPQDDEISVRQQNARADMIDASPLEIQVAYPFVLDSIWNESEKRMVVVDQKDVVRHRHGDFVKGARTIADVIYSANAQHLDGLLAQGAVATYRFERASFANSVKNEYAQNGNIEYKTRIVYHMAPQHVQKYDAADYIKATIIAASADTAKLNLSGTSLPSFTFVQDTLMFNKYTDRQTSEVKFKNLPDYKHPKMTGYMWFNKNQNSNWEDFTGWESDKGFRIMPIQNTIGDALYLQNLDYTHVGNDFVYTERYSDDVFFRGWKITEYKDENKKAGEVVDVSLELHNISKALTPEGNIKPNFSVEARFIYNREDVNIDNPQSMVVNEVFGLADRLTYTPAIRVHKEDGEAATNNNKYETRVNKHDYSGQMFRKQLDSYSVKNETIVCENILTHGDNEFVWYTLPKTTSSIADLMNFTSDLLEDYVEPEYAKRTDVFFAPYVSQLEMEQGQAYGIQNKSRVHTIYLHAKNLVPTVTPGGDDANRKIALLKFYKEAGDDEGRNDWDNTFFYRSLDPRASWASGAKQELWQGDKTDTLVFKINLNDQNLVNKLVNEGLPVQIYYRTEGENYSYKYRHDEEITRSGSAKEDDGWFRSAVQFGMVTGTGNGYNEFWTVGATDRGVFTNMYGDGVVGSYPSTWAVNLKKFNPFENDIDGIYRDMFDKSLSAHIIGQPCYQGDSSSFFVSGLNLIAPIEFNRVSTKLKGSTGFSYTVYPVQDLNPETEGANYGEEKILQGKRMLCPNKYGELMVWVVAKPIATDTLGLVKEVIPTVHGKVIAQNVINDTISLKPVQTSTRRQTLVYTFNTKIDMPHFGGNIAAGSDLFDSFGIVRTDSLWAGVKVAVKEPKLKFTSKDGKAIDMVDFSKAVVGMDTDTTICLVASDMPHYGTSTDLDATDPDYVANSTAMIYVETEGAYKVLSDEVMKIMDLDGDTLDGNFITEIKFAASPNAETPCDRNGALVVKSLCPDAENTNITLAAKYDVGFTGNYADLLHGDVGAMENGKGNKIDLSWKAVAGATNYKLEIGHYDKQKTSEDVFISEFAVKNNNLMVELFNGTGDKLAKDMYVNYYVRIKEGNTIVGKSGIKGQESDVNSSDVVWMYTPRVFNFDGATAFGKAVNFDNGKVYTVELLNGERVIDVFVFQATTDGSVTGLSRRDVGDENPSTVDLKINQTYKISDWETVNRSLPEAAYGWEAAWVQDAISTAQDGLKIRAYNLLPNKAEYYIARLHAINECHSEVVASLPFSTSISDTPTEKVNFDGNSSTSNDNITTQSVKIVGGIQNVNILNAAGKKVIISNVLGQVVVNKELASDNETISAPAGIVVVTVEGEAATKAIVK